MAVPDRIERTLELAHPPAAVWRAITTADGLASWFGEEAEVDLRPGGSIRMRWSGGASVRMRVERVDEPRLLVLTWRLDGVPVDDAPRTRVEFALEPTAGGTRLSVLETGFAQLPDGPGRAAHDDHGEGWTRELGELVVHLDAAPV